MCKIIFLYEKTHRYLQNDYQFFDALKLEEIVIYQQKSNFMS